MALPSWLLTQSAMHAHRIITEAFAVGTPGAYHYRQLATLAEFGPASQASLGRHTGIDRSDVVAALNELAEQGFVERAPDPEDGRRNIITVSPAGLRQLHRLDKLVKRAQDELFAPLSPADRETLSRLLAQVLAHHGGADWSNSAPRPTRKSSRRRSSHRTALAPRSPAQKGD